MATLPARPDLDQLRRQAKELHRAANEGDAESVRRLRSVSHRTNLAAAQLAVARHYGFGSWARMRASVVDRPSGGIAPLMADKHKRNAVYGAADALSWAQRNGWRAGPLPVGAVFTAQSFITARLEQRPDEYGLSDTLTPPNGRVFVTKRQPPVAVACLGAGATALVTHLEHLVALGVRSFIAVGPAPAVSVDLAPEDCVVVDRALRDDGVSNHYLEPARYVSADASLTDSLYRTAAEQGLGPRLGSSWTVPTPYRTTAEELAAYRAEGVLVTELTTAALFAVALALGARAAGAVVATRGPMQRGDASSGPGRRTGRVFTLVEAAISALGAEETA